ncbi:zf-TFIIB domain-containing protein [Compostimonas suwonensis]|uniref:Transcription factor zinc-finger domain-containing protein n=1 Tax=Compostimonas suwonensis TaxID=1048394 RepID=A0A2M9BZE8_9MICO|nr:zf-TFIIB domain-containing protein [Compostimonas suwonensis]PJJ63436.1 hypothetical protein CLV54_1102 [Compostimonas suwonensis]
MKCPNDDVTLVMSERSGIEIDYCPECRGVWLDRGELDKIIDRASAERPAAAAQPAAPAPSVPPQAPAYQQPYPPQPPYQGQPRYEQQRGSYGSNGYDNHGQYRKKKKESWLSELFD